MSPSSKRTCKLGKKCAFTHTEKAGGEPNETKYVCGSRQHSVSQPSSGGSPFAEIQSEERPSARSDSSEIKIYTKNGKNIVNHSDCLARAREDKSHLGSYTTRWTKRSMSECSVIRATRKLYRFYSNQTWNLLATKHGTRTRT